MGCARFEHCLQLTFHPFQFPFISHFPDSDHFSVVPRWFLSRILEVRIVEEDWAEILHRATTAGFLVDGRLNYAEVVKIMAM